jgi:hypothetical protein
LPRSPTRRSSPISAVTAISSLVFHRCDENSVCLRSASLPCAAAYRPFLCWWRGFWGGRRGLAAWGRTRRRGVGDVGHLASFTGGLVDHMLGNLASANASISFCTSWAIWSAHGNVVWSRYSMSLIVLELNRYIVLLLVSDYLLI